uniref:Core-binding (CB) domain-containing protein n=3 Tax=Paenibacillus polymyxa TaxID=1406 RepID=A0AAE9L7Q2_PAEPO
MQFKKKIRYRFRADSIWIDWDRNNKKQLVIICVSDAINNMDIVHPITDFIYTNWRYNSYNTQRKHAINVVAFLNYLLEKNQDTEFKSLTDLKIIHGDIYLNELSKRGNTRTSINGVDRTLNTLYRYLYKNECLPNVSPNAFETYQNQFGEEVHISLFRNVILPSTASSPLEHTFPSRYIPLLFETAIIVAKPIVLGLYFQIFGGLRVGEVVNITRLGVRYRLDGEVVLLNIRERQLRTDIKDSDGANFVKQERKQQVFIYKEWFESIYNDHLELFRSTDGSGALFVNRDGKAMSAKSYRQYFNKLKKEFIRLLQQSPNIQDKLLAHHLNISKWSTHIGRGLFSNLLAEIAQNPYDISVPRGDSSILSALSYLKKTSRFKIKLEERVNHMHGNYIPRLIEQRQEE